MTMHVQKLIILVGGALAVGIFVWVALAAPWRVVVIAGVVLLSMGILLVCILIRRVQREVREAVRATDALGLSAQLEQLRGDQEARAAKVRSQIARLEKVVATGADARALHEELATLEQQLPERLAVRVAADIARLRRSLERE